MTSSAPIATNKLRGFTLVELAIVLVVVSLAVGFGIQAFQNGSSLSCTQTAEQQIKGIEQALKKFVDTNNRYPKPAYATQGTNNPEFGKEATEASDPTKAPYAALVPTNMIHVSGVLFGAVPTATLGLGNEYAADCWGDKFTYAVTNALTSSHNGVGHASNVEGAITVKTGTNGALTDVSTKVAYVIISHGADKHGATPLTSGNITLRHCDGEVSTQLDRMNCDVGGAGDITFVTAPTATGSTATTGVAFDDIVVFADKLAQNRTNLWCWGSNSEGQLGLTGGSDSTVPIQASGIVKFASITPSFSGDNAFWCGLDYDGNAYCWGNNLYGQLGNGDYDSREEPTKVSGSGHYKNLVAGATSVCAISIDDNLTYCWGNNEFGQLGSDSGATVAVPTATADNRLFASLYRAIDSFCGIQANGAAYCWGHNDTGQMGSGGPKESYDSPQAVAGGHLFKQLTGGSGSWCGLATDGSAWCWGRSLAGSSGGGGLEEIPVDGGDEKSGGGGGEEEFELVVDGGIEGGGLELVTVYDTPNAAATGHVFTALTDSAINSVCGVKANGSVWCWGNGNKCQLGQNTACVEDDSENLDLPNAVQVQGYAGFTTVFALPNRYCGYGLSEKLYCWGSGDYYGLANGSTSHNEQAQATTGNISFKGTLASNPNSAVTCGLSTANRAYCWGMGGTGALGKGDMTDSPTPQIVSGGYQFITIAMQTGGSSTCALKTP